MKRGVSITTPDKYKTGDSTQRHRGAEKIREGEEGKWVNGEMEKK